MACSNYKDISSVLKEFQITYTEANFIEEIEFSISDYFREDLQFDKPYFLLVEAKQDKFAEGWAQCLAEMVAAQKLNNDLPITVFGIVSNGEKWEFGKLEDDKLTKTIQPYIIYQLDRLFAAVNYVFQECESQLNELVPV
jgi:hypothetical protein